MKKPTEEQQWAQYLEIPIESLETDNLEAESSSDSSIKVAIRNIFLH